MSPETLPVLRCESRRPRPEPRWGLIAAAIVLMTSTLDALWLVPAQQAMPARDPLGVRDRCGDAPRLSAPAEVPAPSRTANIKVEGVYLMKAPPR